MILSVQSPVGGGVPTSLRGIQQQQQQHQQRRRRQVRKGACRVGLGCDVMLMLCYHDGIARELQHIACLTIRTVRTQFRSCHVDLRHLLISFPLGRINFRATLHAEPWAFRELW